MTEMRSAAVKILGTEYRLRSEADPDHLQEVAEYVDRVLHEVQQRFAPDTQSAAILAALNIASDFLRSRRGIAIAPDRIRSLIELVESAEEAER